MVTFLLGAQGGDEDAFACLHAVTNPVLVRYLRVVADADPAPITQATWASLLDGLSMLDADDDDDWLEVAVGTARECAVVAGALRTSATPVTDPGALTATERDHEPDPVDAGVAMLRACPPAVADVLAMGVVAGLGRDSIARITGLEPTAVLALVNEGQDALGLPLETLSASLRVPGNHAEVGELAAVTPLFEAQSHAPRAVAWGAVTMVGATAAGATMAGAGVAVAAPAAAPVAATAAVAHATPTSAAAVVDLLTWNSPLPTTSRVVLRASAVTAAAAAPSKWTTVGAGVAAWSVAIGGIGAAATMSGFLPSVIDGLFGNHGRTPVVVAQGPREPGETPAPTDGGVAQPRPSGQQPGTKGTVVPVGSSGTGGAVVVSAVSTDFGTGRQVVVSPAVLTNKPPSQTPTPTGPVTTPPTTQKPPTSGGGTVTGAAHGPGKAKGHAYGKGHAKHSTGVAKGRHQAAKPSVKAKAAKAAAAVAKAAKAAAKGKPAKPTTHKAGKSKA
jgi:hypothetical protein